MDGMDDFINSLPEDCITAILSFTTPRDVCRSSAVSSSIKSAADSNNTWERLLPPDYDRLLSNSVSPVEMEFASKKELYFRLCNSILIESGKKIFWLERSTGKKCYMLSARDLSITWGNDPMYWCWKSLPQSRFSEVAELRNVCWLEIYGRISSSLLSSKTKYGAYLVLKFANRAYGLDSIPSEISVEVGNDYITNGTAYLRCQENDDKHQQLEGIFYSNRMQMLRSRVKIEGDGRVPHERKDGWMEIELGEFFVNSGNRDQGEVRMSLMEVKGEHLKAGLIIEGIEVRPKL